ncbi:MAG TPA: HD domain-containing phosphohydrolase [Actinomycetota bacterium]|nr:HD domain-containing phosphohydrolase [Actinomycetota bacterium]
MPDDELRLADLMAALSVTTDLAMGQAPEKAVRACVVAAEAARRLDLPEHEVAATYYATLLKHLGCTASSHEEVLLFGPDDLSMREVAERTDVARGREMVALMRLTGRGAGLRRPAYVVRALTAGADGEASVMRATCEVGALMAERLGLGDEVRRAVHENLERWDGKGEPQKLRGDDIAIAARIAEPATQAVIFHRLGGPEAVSEMLGRRSGGWFDPAVAAVVREVAPAILDHLEEADPWTAVLDAEPEPVRRVPAKRLDGVAAAFADMVDLKSAFTLGHSSGVADLAGAAAEPLGFADPVAIRRAALLHDLGRTAVGTGVWERAGRLSTAQWEEVRLHPYHTERILARSSALEPLARIAGMHHERQDGSGYHHGASASGVPAEARLLAAADVYQALTQDRPHRPGRPPEEAAQVLTSEATAGRVDPEFVRAVVEAAGQRVPGAKTSWPAGLSDREVDVIRLVARGLTNRGIAERLVISSRTAEHHVQHIYAKIGASTRAAAAMFAMEHGLLAE